LTPAVAGLIRKPARVTILDVGGDKVGATVLAALADALDGKIYRMLQVINPFRPFTDTLKGCVKMKDEIEKASRMTVSGIIGNANLIDETTVDLIYEGYNFVSEVSDETGLPLEFITVSSQLADMIDMKRFSCPVLKMQRQLVPPWKKAAAL
jgi:hypothetical protein